MAWYDNMQAPNAKMMQYGMQMMQPRPPGYQNLPFYAGAPQPQMQAAPYTGDAQGQMQNLVQPSPSGKRRVRIGNKVYEEVDDGQAPAAPAAPAPQGQGY